MRVRGRDRPRRGPLGQRPARPHDRRPERPPAAAGRRLCLHADRQEAGPPTPARPAIAAAMYTLFFRSAPHPLFTTFDAPDFQTVCTRRGRSNTPLQALTVANDEAFLEFAQGLAARVLREVPADDRRRPPPPRFLLALCREPSRRRAGRPARLLRPASCRPGQGRRSVPRRCFPPTWRRQCERRNRRGAGAGQPGHSQHGQLHHPRIVRHVRTSTVPTDDVRQSDNPQFRNPQSANPHTRRHFFGQCGVGVGAIALNQLLAAGRRRGAAPREARSGQSARPAAAALSAPRPRTSSTCSWPARRASSSCSTTSPSSASCTASRRRRACSKASGSRSSRGTKR